MTRTSFSSQSWFLPASYSLTAHARWRMSKRGISESALTAAVYFGHIADARGAEVFSIGPKEVRLAKRQGIDLSAFEGVRVVCSMTGHVLTAYRNRGRCRPHP